MIQGTTRHSRRKELLPTIQPQKQRPKDPTKMQKHYVDQSQIFPGSGDGDGRLAPTKDLTPHTSTSRAPTYQRQQEPTKSKLGISCWSVRLWMMVLPHRKTTKVCGKRVVGIQTIDRGEEVTPPIVVRHRRDGVRVLSGCAIARASARRPPSPAETGTEKDFGNTHAPRICFHLEESSAVGHVELSLLIIVVASRRSWSLLMGK